MFKKKRGKSCGIIAPKMVQNVFLCRRRRRRRRCRNRSTLNRCAESFAPAWGSSKRSVQAARVGLASDSTKIPHEENHPDRCPGAGGRARVPSGKHPGGKAADPLREPVPRNGSFDEPGGHRFQPAVAGMGRTGVSRGVLAERDGPAQPDHEISQRGRVRVREQRHPRLRPHEQGPLEPVQHPGAAGVGRREPGRLRVSVHARARVGAPGLLPGDVRPAPHQRRTDQHAAVRLPSLHVQRGAGPAARGQPRGVEREGESLEHRSGG